MGVGFPFGDNPLAGVSNSVRLFPFSDFSHFFATSLRPPFSHYLRASFFCYISLF